jgi:UDP-2,3-diacylglucosamine hydrolase
VTPRLPPVADRPAPTPPVVVAGDVHLSPDDPATADRFEAFLRGLPGRCATLLILGDLFDAWVGRAQAREPFARRFLDLLRGLAGAGVRIAFQAGNRDYAFDGADGLALDLWPDVVRTTGGGRVVVLTHGDLLCSADHRYQRMRSLLRGPVGKGALALLPYRVKAWLARGLRGLSRREVRRKPLASMGIDYGLARAWLDGYGADVLVAGHVHTGVHHRLPGDRPRDVLVLRDWSDAGGAVVRWDGSSIALEAP